MSGQVFWIRKFTRGLMAAVFAFGSLTPAYAQAISSGRGSLSSVPLHVAPGMKGMTVDPADPFALTFLMEPGDASLAQADRSRTYERLIRYFLVSLTVPEDDLWVNLSPYEDGRIIADNFGMTVMGRDLLEQDHVLKQATASLFNPDKEPGKSFWKKVYQEAFERYGTTDVPIDTFNKVWVVPDEARIYEEGDSVILVQSHLKVMLEQDYLARERAGRNMEERQDQGHGEVSGRLSREAVRAWILPVLEKEVNEGEAFAVLRQATAALILATWYKKVWKGRLLNQMYSDRSRVKGVDQDPANNLKVFQAYVTAFEEGSLNSIREEYDVLSGEVIPRKYFSGGYSTRLPVDGAQSTTSLAERIRRVFELPAGVRDRGYHLVTAVFSKEREGAARTSRATVSKALISAIMMMNFFVPRPLPAITPSNVKLLTSETRLSQHSAVNWSVEGERRLNQIVAKHLRKNGGTLGINPAEFPQLAAVLNRVNFRGVPEPYTLLSSVMVSAFRTAAPDEEKSFQLTRQSALFLQRMIANWVDYSSLKGDMGDLLTARGWNCEAISKMTLLILEGEWGAKGVELVEVKVDHKGVRYPVRDPKYPDFDIGHVTVLVHSGRRVAVADQGREIKHQVYVLNVGGRRAEVPAAMLSGTAWRGMRLAELGEDARVKREIARLMLQNNAMHGIDASSLVIIKKLVARLDALEGSPAAVWNAEDMNRLRRALQENLATARGVNWANELIRQYNRSLTDLAARLNQAEKLYAGKEFSKAYQEFLSIAAEARRVRGDMQKKFERSSVSIRDKAGKLRQYDEVIRVAGNNAEICRLAAANATAGGGRVTAPEGQGDGVVSRRDGPQAVLNEHKRIQADVNATMAEVSRQSLRSPAAALRLLDALERRLNASLAAQRPKYERLLSDPALKLSINGRPATLNSFLALYTEARKMIREARAQIRFNADVIRCNVFVNRFNTLQRNSQAMRDLVRDIDGFLNTPGVDQGLRSQAESIRREVLSQADNAEAPAGERHLGGIDLSPRSLVWEVEERHDMELLSRPVAPDMTDLQGLTPRILRVVPAEGFSQGAASRR